MSYKWLVIPGLYTVCEFAFYLRWKYLKYKVNHTLSKKLNKPHLPHSRLQEFRNYTMMYIQYSLLTPKQWLQHWFRNCKFEDIKKGNVIEYLNCMFFEKLRAHSKDSVVENVIDPHYFQLRKSSKMYISADEIKNSIMKSSSFRNDSASISPSKKWQINFIQKSYNLMREQCECDFENGFNPNIEFYSSGRDDEKVISSYYPLIVFIIFGIVHRSFNLVLQYYFHLEYEYFHGLKIWHNLNRNRTQNKKLLKMEPILIIHGLAVRFSCWFLFLRKLFHKFEDRNQCKDVFLMEIPWATISLRNYFPDCSSFFELFGLHLHFQSFLDSKVPNTAKDMTAILFDLERRMIAKNGNKCDFQWTFIGHSYGTACCSSIYQTMKNMIKLANDANKSIRMNIPRLILIDPITLCMSEPKSIAVVTVRKQENEARFAFKELMASTLLRRYFHWGECVLFPHQMMNDEKEHIIVCGDVDGLVPSHVVQTSIGIVNKLIAKNKNGKKIEYIEMKGLSHGRFMLSNKYTQMVVDRV